MKSIRSFAMLILATFLAAPAKLAAGEQLSGTWLTQDGSSHVKFQPCGETVCGQIVWLREPIDPATKAPWRDKLNSDSAQQGRPLVGLSIATKLKPVDARHWRGDLYNPLDGNTYTGTFTNLDANSLQLEGCALAGLLCQQEIWRRVN